LVIYADYTFVYADGPVLHFTYINNDSVTRFKQQSIHYPVALKMQHQVLSLHLSGYQIAFFLISDLNGRVLLVSTVYQDLIHSNSDHILLNYSSHHPLVQKIQNQYYHYIHRIPNCILLHVKPPQQSCKHCGWKSTL